ncbi:MAG: hypothetical protein F6K00_33255 [Leptolyngbya sp. SIOISBB]|nr:hypothetical protein [Leptolyngbya sp. SIOISBB]
MAFTDCPGFYPALATLIVQHGPYEQVEAVLNIPDLNEQQQQLLQANLDFFIVSTPVVSLEMRMPPGHQGNCLLAIQPGGDSRTTSKGNDITLRYQDLPFAWITGVVTSYGQFLRAFAVAYTLNSRRPSAS